MFSYEFNADVRLMHHIFTNNTQETNNNKNDIIGFVTYLGV